MISLKRKKFHIRRLVRLGSDPRRMMISVFEAANIVHQDFPEMSPSKITMDVLTPTLQKPEGFRVKTSEGEEHQEKVKHYFQLFFRQHSTAPI